MSNPTEETLQCVTVWQYGSYTSMNRSCTTMHGTNCTNCTNLYRNCALLKMVTKGLGVEHESSMGINFSSTVQYGHLSVYCTLNVLYSQLCYVCTVLTFKLGVFCTHSFIMSVLYSQSTVLTTNFTHSIVCSLLTVNCTHN